MVKDCKECTEQVKESREVENIGPEEDAARGARTEREAEEPLEGGAGLGTTPEPARVSDLGGCWEKNADKDYKGD